MTNNYGEIGQVEELRIPWTYKGPLSLDENRERAHKRPFSMLKQHAPLVPCEEVLYSGMRPQPFSMTGAETCTDHWLLQILRILSCLHVDCVHGHSNLLQLLSWSHEISHAAANACSHSWKVYLSKGMSAMCPLHALL